MNKLTCMVVLCLAAPLCAAPIHIQKFDTNHSTIAFRVPILGGMSQVEGKFTDFALDVVYDDQALAQSGVVATIQAASINTGIDARDKDLRSPNFFDVAKFPEIRFESSQIEKSRDGFVARGQLTMHGVTKPLTLPFHVTGIRRDDATKTMVIAFAAETHLNRRDFGITWTHSADPLFVGDDIGVVIHLITKRIPI